MRNNILVVENLDKNINKISKLVYDELEKTKTIIHVSKDTNHIANIIENNYIDLMIVNLGLNPNKILDALTKIDFKLSKREFKIPIIVYCGSKDKVIIEKIFALGAIDYFFEKLESRDILPLISLKIKRALKNYKYNDHLIKKNDQNKKQLQLATILQKSLMFDYKSLSNIEIIGKFIPSAEIGGDCYDVIETESKTWFMIADVMGHGASAALVTFMIKALFNQLASTYKTPKKLLEEINETYYKMFENKSDIIFSIFVGTIHKNRLTYCSAGHPYPVFYDSKTKSTHFLSNNNILVGIVPHSNFSQKIQTINKGDMIFAYTDGLYEQTPEKNDINLIRNYVQDNGNLLKSSPNKFINNILKEFKDKENIEDDISILALKKK